MKYLYYKDVALPPRHSSLKSRSLADTSVEFLGRKFSLPVIPANMKDVIDIDIARQLCDSHHFYIMHRWFYGPENNDMNIHEILNFVRIFTSEKRMISISIGVGPTWEDFVKELVDCGLKVDFITIDVAHADHDNVINTIKVVKFHLPETKLIVGNVATAEGCEFLIKQGVDAVKIGIGGGCFIPNTPIKTETGNKNIQNVNVGEKVLTHTGEYKPVTNTFVFDRKEELIKINDSITCTKNHEFYVIHKKDADKVNDSNLKDYALWIEAKNLTDEYFLIEMDK
jgi:hypothetical protein